MWKESIKYLGVQLDRRLSFSEHLQIATTKAIQCGANLARLMFNIGEPRETKRRLVVSMVHSKLLYAAPALASVPQIHLLAKERQETFQPRKELTCATNQQVIARAREAICEEGRRKLFEI